MTRWSGPTSVITKLGWTVFELMKAKKGKRWQCRIDFVSKKSVVRIVRPE
jgi:hypothetical protein